MKFIEPTQKPTQKDSLDQVTDKIKRLLQIGQTDEHAEDAVIARFMRGLDNRFIMLHNMQLGSLGEVFPTILVGPAGLFVLNISHVKGFYKVKEDAWLEMNKTSHKYGPVRPNLIKQSKDFAQKLAQILEAHGKSHPEIVPILIFANPGVHVETSKPAIRIVLMDGVDSLIDSMFNSEEVLKPTEIDYLADSLEIMSNPEKAIPMGEGEDFFGRDLFIPEKKAPLTLPEIPIPTELPLEPVEKKLSFSRNQWVILAVLLVATIIVLFGAILFIMRII
jgi:hypothetical protein